MPVRLRNVSGVALVAVLIVVSTAAAPASWPYLHGREDARVTSEHRWASVSAEMGRYLAAVAARDRQAWLDAQARAEAARAAETAGRARAKVRHPSASGSVSTGSASSGRCGGDLPPCYVMMRESRGSLTAENPVSTASGKWQFLDSTWDGYGGYSHAADAPESVQDARARAVWAGGSGCSNWSAC